MSVFEACAGIDKLRELERNHVFSDEVLIAIDRMWRDILFGDNDIITDHREIAQDYYIATL